MKFDVNRLRGKEVISDQPEQKQEVVKIQPMTVTVHRQQLSKTIYKILKGEADGIFLTKEKTCGIYFEQAGEFLKIGLCLTPMDGVVGQQFMKPSEYADINKKEAEQRKKASQPPEWNGGESKIEDTTY